MIAAIGECLIEITERGGVLRQAYGGDTLNTLTYLARLLPQRRESLYFCTALGKDLFSQQMLRSWRQEGIRTELVRQIGNRLPGLYYIRTDLAGERLFWYWREQSAARFALTSAFHRKVLRKLSACEIFYFSGISVAILPAAGRRRLLQLLAELKAGGTRVVFDSNYRPPLWKSVEEARSWIEAAYGVVDLALVSFTDANRLASQVVQYAGAIVPIEETPSFQELL